MDRTHDDYIVRALHARRRDHRKPMTIDEKRALRILDAIEESGHTVRVAGLTTPHHSKVRELLMRARLAT